MSTHAERNSKSPSQEIRSIIEEVQKAADDTQSIAYRYEDWEDGSRLEIRCFPTPRSSGETAPAPSLEVEGTYHLTKDGRVFECQAKVVSDADSTEYRMARVEDSKAEGGFSLREMPVALEWVQVDTEVAKKHRLTVIPHEVKL